MATLFNGTFAAPTARGSLPSGHWVELQDSVLRVGSIDPGDVQQLLDTLRDAGQVIRRVQLIRPTLEELFIDTVAAPTTTTSPQPPGAPGKPGRQTRA
jgi:hypothetical protein